MEALKIVKEVLGEKHPEYAISLNSLAGLYWKTGQYNKAVLLLSEALKIRKEVLGEKHPDYATSLNNLASLYYSMGQYDKAEPLYKESLKIRKEVLGERHPSYASSLNNLANLYYAIGQYEKAEPLLKEAVKTRKELLGEKHPDYAQSLGNLAALYREMGHYSEAEPLYMESLKIRKEVLGEKSPEYALSLSHLASLYHAMDQYDKAEPLCKEVIKIYKEALGEKHPDYASSLNNLGSLYETAGQYDKAEPLYKEALKIIKEVLGEKHPNYASSMNNLAGLFRNMGQYDKAEPLYKEALQLRKEVLGEKHPDYASSLSGLAGFYSVMGKYEKAEPLLKEALIIRKAIFGEKHPDYASSLNNLAELYRKMGRYDNAEPLYKEALQLRKEILGEKHSDYAVSLIGMAVLYVNTEQYDKAEPLYTEASKIFKEVFGEKHPSYAISLIWLALLYSNMEQYDKAEPFFIDANKNYISQLESYYPALSENEKMKFLKTIDYNFELFYSFALKREKENPTISNDIMQLRIQTKGIILTSTAGVKSRILKSGNEELIGLYNQLTNIHSEIAYAYTQSNQEQKKRGIDLVSLETQANDIEKQLSGKSEDYKSELEKRKIDWKEIQKTIKPDEAAIEFLSFQYYDKNWTEMTYYCALIVREEYKNPVLVRLCTEEELSQYLKLNAEESNSYIKNNENNRKIYDLIWKPLEKYLSGTNTVYLSPSGLLNKISFSVLSGEENTLISDKYSLHYMGNLKDIVTKKKENSIKSINGFTAVIFGGVDFNLDSANMISNAEKYRTEIKNNIYLNIPDTLKEQNNREIDERGGWGYLKGTLDEADNIKRIFEKNGLEAKEYTGADASEDALKSLSQTEYKSSPTILHIATHGFFFPEPTKEYGAFQMLQKGGSEVIKHSENPLLRSGIILAGANHFWQTNKSIEGAEDGILTAYEVCNMDLTNTELVVLSACETGLGDIKGGEGVYGLQRAFKVAGAKTIIMSLWKVPDKETVELMELFYTNWLNGMTKHDAFTNAQKEMRNKYAPYYWAAFVMVE
jgi:tetratricopeptide (TPR) repeat protein